MTKSRGFVSFRTFTLAFAVVLTPALMQTGGTGCEPSEQLEVLELEVTGGPPLELLGPVFTPGFSGPYSLSRICAPLEDCMAAPDLLVRAYASHPESPVEYTYTFGSSDYEWCWDELGNFVQCPPPISGSLDPGGGEVVLEGALRVLSCSGWAGELRIDVWCPPTHSGMCVANRYTVQVYQATYCGPGGR